jgi:hypothetical protein
MSLPATISSSITKMMGALLSVGPATAPMILIMTFIMAESMSVAVEKHISEMERRSIMGIILNGR